MLNQASTIASQNVGTTADSQQRASASAVVQGLMDEMMTVANRQYQGTYIFAGQACDRAPFEQSQTGVIYKGDSRSLMLNLDGTGATPISLSGDEVFGATQAAVRGSQSLMPAVDGSMRMSDLRGLNGVIHPGQIVIDEVGGAGLFTVDLTKASTLSDVLSAIDAASAAAGATVSASLSAQGLVLTAGAGKTLTVGEQGGGTTAEDLGILVTVPTAPPVTGGNLEPKVTLTTQLGCAAGRAGDRQGQRAGADGRHEGGEGGPVGGGDRTGHAQRDQRFGDGGDGADQRGRHGHRRDQPGFGRQPEHRGGRRADGDAAGSADLHGHDAAESH